MIKKEEIKEGLEFVLPYSEFKSEEDEKEYIRCLVRHGFDGVSHWKNAFYTKIQFDGEEYTVKTRKRPVFEVIDKVVFKNDSVFVKNKNASITDDVFMLIDFSFVEKFGEKAGKKQKIKRRNKEIREMYDVPYLGKYSIIDLNSAIENNKPCNVKKDAEGEMSLKVDFELSEETCKKLNKFYEDLARIAKELAETGSEKEDADRFKEITDKMLETYKSKNKDYGDSFRNLFKECGMTYAYGHLREKLERIKSLKDNEAKVKGESMKDSLYDLANYAILTIMEIEKNKKEQEE